MKKKFRNIEVNGKQYAWSSKMVDGQKLKLKIWFEKKVIYEDFMPEFMKAVTPRTVKYHIEKIQRKEHREGVIKSK